MHTCIYMNGNTFYYCLYQSPHTNVKIKLKPHCYTKATCSASWVTVQTLWVTPG